MSFIKFNITVDQAADQFANWWLPFQNPQITVQRKREILAATKYNFLVNAFNASTVLLVIAVASVAMFAYAAAVSLGAVAIFTRLVTEKEIDKIAAPLDGAADLVIETIRHALNIADSKKRELNILRRVGVISRDWEETTGVLFGYAVWRATVPLPG